MYSAATPEVLPLFGVVLAGFVLLVVWRTPPLIVVLLTAFAAIAASALTAASVHAVT